MLKTLLVAVLMVVANSAAYAQQAIIDPPFGFSWTDTAPTILAKFQSAEKEIDGDLTIIHISGPASADLPSNTDRVSLLFSEGFGLVKVIWYSEDITDDIFGDAGKKVFENVYGALVAKLGKGDDYRRIGEDLYKDPNEFYECLDYEGCGAWMTFWHGTQDENSSAMLQLDGLSRGVGFVIYSVENPKWYKRGDRIREGDASKF